MKKLMRNNWVAIGLSVFICFNVTPGIENEPVRTRDWKLMV
ncbi:hypothetical protein ACQKM1_22370 [Peribacillus frigoritolerans]